ncbi:MAG: SusD/RagB family nutrient-binding outer membrane lipoprotein, partial [Saprospiraceae bacterium]|nr:SusD/RagB family nutrient-binding outer membrane lipoprotein [Saprospiraceae bacterium]
MKNIFKIFLAFGLLVFVSACDSLDLDEQAINPNSVTPENAEINLVMNNAMIELGDLIDEASDETMPYVRMVALTGGARYDNQDGPSSFDFMWDLAYSQILPDCNLIIQLAEENGGFTRHSGVAKIIKAYTMLTLVDLFGDVPYSQAFQGTDELNPAADAGASVYDAAIGLLDNAISDLGNPTGTITNDIFYGGSDASWIKAANSLKLKAHLNTGNTAQINTLIGEDNMISAEGDDFQFQYGTNRSTPDSRHP